MQSDPAAILLEPMYDPNKMPFVQSTGTQKYGMCHQKFCKQNVWHQPSKVEKPSR